MSDWAEIHQQNVEARLLGELPDLTEDKQRGTVQSDTFTEIQNQETEIGGRFHVSGGLAQDRLRVQEKQVPLQDVDPRPLP